MDDSIGLWGLRNRFLDKVAFEPMSGCWLWFGGLDGCGYGYIRIAGKHYGTHRYSYETLVGAIPEGMELDHYCQTPCCVNPGHLQVVTPTRNKQLAGERRTHCAKGHEYTEENTTRREGYKRCRQCQRDASANYLQRKKANR